MTLHVPMGVKIGDSVHKNEMEASWLRKEDLLHYHWTNSDAMCLRRLASLGKISIDNHSDEIQLVMGMAHSKP